MKNGLIAVVLLSVLFCAQANRISDSQQRYIKKYEKQKTVPQPDAMLLNTDPEPALTDDFTPLFNGKDLNGWAPKGGKHTFEAVDGVIRGTCIKDTPNAFLTTDKIYSDFIFTCEMKWVVNGNSGVMIRARNRIDEKGNTRVYGPQVEMEGINTERRWSGGIYGEAIGGWLYPLWLDAHEEVRQAIKADDWNRLTIKAEGDTIKTWLNGIPAAHWKTAEYMEGFFGLQVHSGDRGTIQWRNLMIREL